MIAVVIGSMFICEPRLWAHHPDRNCRAASPDAFRTDRRAAKSVRLRKHTLYRLKPITTAAAAAPSTTTATMVHSNAPKRDHIVSSLPSLVWPLAEAPTGQAEADAYTPRLIGA